MDFFQPGRRCQDVKYLHRSNHSFTALYIQQNSKHSLLKVYFVPDIFMK